MQHLMNSIKYLLMPYSLEEIRTDEQLKPGNKSHKDENINPKASMTDNSISHLGILNQSL